MKTKASKQPKQSKPAVQLKDIKPKQNPKAGGGDGLITFWYLNDSTGRGYRDQKVTK